MSSSDSSDSSFFSSSFFSSATKGERSQDLPTSPARGSHAAQKPSQTVTVTPGSGSCAVPTTPRTPGCHCGIRGLEPSQPLPVQCETPPEQVPSLAVRMRSRWHTEGSASVPRQRQSCTRTPRAVPGSRRVRVCSLRNSHAHYGAQAAVEPEPSCLSGRYPSAVEPSPSPAARSAGGRARSLTRGSAARGRSAAGRRGRSRSPAAAGSDVTDEAADVDVGQRLRRGAAGDPRSRGAAPAESRPERGDGAAPRPAGQPAAEAAGLGASRARHGRQLEANAQGSAAPASGTGEPPRLRSAPGSPRPPPRFAPRRARPRCPAGAHLREEARPEGLHVHSGRLDERVDLVLLQRERRSAAGTAPPPCRGPPPSCAGAAGARGPRSP